MRRNGKVSVKRHLAKTISWRIIGTLDTITLGWIITGDLKLGFQIGGVEVISKMGLYFIHERVWYKTSFGLGQNPEIMEEKPVEIPKNEQIRKR